MTYIVLPALFLASSFASAETPRPLPVYLFERDAASLSVDVVPENGGADEAGDPWSARESDAAFASFEEPACETAFFDRGEDGFGGPYDGPDF